MEWLQQNLQLGLLTVFCAWAFGAGALRVLERV
jgi:hypothetical protein